MYCINKRGMTQLDICL